MQFQSLETTLEQFPLDFDQKTHWISGANDPEFSLLHTISLTFLSTGKVEQVTRVDSQNMGVYTVYRLGNERPFSALKCVW